MDQKPIPPAILKPARQQDESFAVYKARRAYAHKLLKAATPTFFPGIAKERQTGTKSRFGWETKALRQYRRRFTIMGAE